MRLSSSWAESEPLENVQSILLQEDFMRAALMNSPLLARTYFLSYRRRFTLNKTRFPSLDRFSSFLNHCMGRPQPPCMQPPWLIKSLLLCQPLLLSLLTSSWIELKPLENLHGFFLCCQAYKLTLLLNTRPTLFLTSSCSPVRSKRRQRSVSSMRSSYRCWAYHETIWSEMHQLLNIFSFF